MKVICLLNCTHFRYQGRSRPIIMFSRTTIYEGLALFLGGGSVDKLNEYMKLIEALKFLCWSLEVV